MYLEFKVQMGLLRSFMEKYKVSKWLTYHPKMARWECKCGVTYLSRIQANRCYTNEHPWIKDLAANLDKATT